MVSQLSRGVVACLMAAASLISAADSPETVRVYIGTFNSRTSKGIYLSEFNVKTGAITDPELAGEAVDAGFLAIHPSKKFLYSVCKFKNAAGETIGGVNAFAIDSETGKLTLLNQQSSEGSGPCHLVVDAAGKNVLVANYGGGNVAALPIGNDGKLAKAASMRQHAGSSVDAKRQTAPHAHSINLDATSRYAFAADLGLDQVLVYQFDASKGLLTPNDPPFAKVAPGAGPRHFAFHPSGQYAYVINELGNTVTGFDYDAEKGKLTEIQTISTLPPDFKEPSYTAEVVVHPSGKYLYGSNRYHNSLAVFAVDPATGKLSLLEITPVGGKLPRNFNVDPTGQWIIVGNHEDDTLSVMKIAADGRLKLIRNDVPVSAAVCIKFVTR